MSSTDGSPISRRAWLGATSGVIAAGLLKTQADAVRLSAQEVQVAPSAAAPVAAPDPTKVPGRLVSELGQRAPAEQPLRLTRTPALSSSSRTPLQDLCGTITPSDLHFERHHAGIPSIDADEHELLVHGMVDRPTVFKMADLKRYPEVSRIHFVECSGNGGGAYNPDRMRTEMSPQTLDGLLSNSEWTGVMLSTILYEVGVRPGASWVLAEGRDAAMMSRSIPLEKAMDDAMLAYGQNGEAIRPEQGYPLRLALPGWEGNAQVKWLRRIEVSDRPTMTRDDHDHHDHDPPTDDHDHDHNGPADDHHHDPPADDHHNNHGTARLHVHNDDASADDYHHHRTTRRRFDRSTAARVG